MYRIAMTAAEGCPRAKSVIDALSFKSSITIPQYKEVAAAIVYCND